MTLDQLAHIATIIQVVFFIISVYFIWREVRENTKLTRATNIRSLVALSSPINMQLIQDRQMAELWVTGAKNYAEMDEIDKYRYDTLLSWWLILHENIYYQHEQGLLDSRMYAAWSRDLEDIVKRQNLGQLWDKMKDLYAPEFAQHVSHVVDKYKPVIEASKGGTKV
jgi:hypothetical protein